MIINVRDKYQLCKCVGDVGGRVSAGDRLSKEKENSERERAELTRLIADNDAASHRDRLQLAERNARYVHDLRGQIAYNGRQRAAATDEEARRHASEMDADREYYRKLADVLRSPIDLNVHPIREHDALLRQRQVGVTSRPLDC